MKDKNATDTKSDGGGSTGGDDPLARLDDRLEALQLIGVFGFGAAAVGALIGWMSARWMRASFWWGCLWLPPLAAAIGLILIGALSGDTAIAVISALTGLAAGHIGAGVLVELDDRRAGDDRGHQARERTGPHHVVFRWIAVRRIRNGGMTDDIPIGVTRRGRIAAIKRGDESGSHCLIVGTTGAGKSTVLGILGFEYAHQGHGVVLVEAKRDAGLEEQARRAAARFGRPFVMVSADGPTVWDVLATGGVDETVAKLLACERYSEPYYEAQATRFLRWVVRTIEATESRLTLSSVLALAEPNRLTAHAAKHADPALATEVEGFVGSLTPKEQADLGGVRSRLAVLAESEFGRRWLDPDSEAGPILDLAEAIRSRAIVYFRLDAERFGIVAEKVGAAVAIELGAIASELQVEPIPTFVGIDELGALESDHAESLFTRGRGAGFSIAVATHTLADLRAGGEAFEDRVKATVDGIVDLRVGPEDADALARMGGQVGEWHHTRRTVGMLGIAEPAGTRTRGYRMRLHPSVLQNLGRGECAVFRLDRSDGNRAVIARVVPSWERGYRYRPNPPTGLFAEGIDPDDRPPVAGVRPEPPDYFGTGVRRPPLLPF